MSANSKGDGGAGKLAGVLGGCTLGEALARLALKQNRVRFEAAQRPGEVSGECEVECEGVLRAYAPTDGEELQEEKVRWGGGHEDGRRGEEEARGDSCRAWEVRGEGVCRFGRMARARADRCAARRDRRRRREQTQTSVRVTVIICQLDGSSLTGLKLVQRITFGREWFKFNGTRGEHSYLCIDSP